jgi:hypothetical protein
MEIKNATAACTGTNDANVSVACFEGGIRAGEKWDAANFNVNQTEAD